MHQATPGLLQCQFGRKVLLPIFLSVIVQTIAAPSADAQISATQGALNQQIGQFGEGLCELFVKAQGQDIHRLAYNNSGHGIDYLIRSIGPDGQPTYRIVEVKTTTQATLPELDVTRAGKQLSFEWIEQNLQQAARSHSDATTRQLAREALNALHNAPQTVQAELHFVSVHGDKYAIYPVDHRNAKIRGAIAEFRIEPELKKCIDRFQNKPLKDQAVRLLRQHDQLRAPCDPRVVSKPEFVDKVAKTAKVSASEAEQALTQAAEKVRAPGGSYSVKIGDKFLKFAGKAAGPGGVVAIEIIVISAEAYEIEKRYDNGEITRDEADRLLAGLVANSAVGLGGGLGGAAVGASIGTLICPGPGTIIGGVVGGVTGYIGSVEIFELSGIKEMLAEYLQPAVTAIREAKDRAVDTLSQAADAASEAIGAAAETAWETAKSGWSWLRRQFE